MKKLTRLAVLALFLAAPAHAFEQGSNGLYTVSLSDVEQAVASALQENGTAALATARIENVSRDTAFGHNAPLTASIKALKADSVSKRWSANINFVSGNEIVSVIPMQGKYSEMVLLPTAKRQISSGQTIAEGDVEMRPYPLTYARAGVLKDAADLIGKAPHRSVSPNRPLREEEFSTPNVIRKNASVTLQYKTNAINITTTGQALENGSVGDMIQVLNINSKKIVRATILDKDTVSVSGPINTIAAAPQPQPSAQAASLEGIYAN